LGSSIDQAGASGRSHLIRGSLAKERVIVFATAAIEFGSVCACG
jgi:hypothetical protein